MSLTVKNLAQRLQIKPSTLYAWVSHGKIPCRKTYGLVRFDPTEIDHWLASFSSPPSAPTKIRTCKTEHTDLEQLIASAERAVYASSHGETRPRSSLIGKEERDGALEA